VDLSGIIFVVLAVGWAAYLLPMALRHHDEVDQSRPVEEFSGSLRVLGHAVKRAAAPTAPVEPVETRSPGSPVDPVETRAVEAPVRTITREAARNAAARRRRVLALLLTTLVAVSITSYLSYTPWFTTAIPGGLVVAFLVVARLTVRAQQVRRVAPVQQSLEASSVEPASPSLVEPVETRTHLDLGIEDTEGLSRAELDEVLAAPEMDDGGLWDPLPVTLPTYVTKARARRTVRTVELTGAMTSSGHDAADSALAREAAAAEATAAPEAESDERRVAGA